MKNRIKEIREDAKLTQTEFAESIGLKKTSVENWENDYYDIPLKRLMQISNIYGYSMDYILCLSDYNLNYTKLDTINLEVLSKNLRKVKRTYNLTQSDMAKVATIAPSTYSKYERGVNTITTMTLYSICKKFHVSMDEMLGRKEVIEYKFD